LVSKVFSGRTRLRFLAEELCELLVGVRRKRRERRRFWGAGFQDRFSSDVTILSGNRLCENCQADGALFGTRECQCLSVIDADLQQLVEIWPGIPSQFRKQILELARGLADRL
jgi:hypothetical protein